MKYPQLVSMPSTVQDWLDEQLEARGIDAVVYTRYIFSLLQRDTLDFPDDLLTLSSSKSKEVGRRGRKRGRKEEYWDVWDCEQLKRSAAVECLMSASEQKFGIEKLVDELCAKLKEIQSEGEELAPQTRTSAREVQRQSPSDQAQKYYAAFPPLGKSEDSNYKPTVLNVCQSSAWGSKKILSNSFGKNKQQIGDLDSGSKPLGVKHCVENKENQEKNAGSLLSEVDKVNMKSINQENDKCLHYSGENELSLHLALNMRSEWCNDDGDESEFVPHFDTVTGWRVCRYSRQNREEMENIGDAGCCQYHDRSTVSKQKVNLEYEAFENCERESGQYVDENLAQLIAKFDHSIEALWSPENRSENASPEEKMDSVSPMVSSQSLNAELGNSVIINPVSDLGHPFLPRGTNITNSIWSTHPPLTKALSSDEKVHLEPLNPSGYSANCTDQDMTEGKMAACAPDTKIDNTGYIIGNKSVSSDVTDKNLLPLNMVDWNEDFPSTAMTSESREYTYSAKCKIASDKGWPIADNSDSLIEKFPNYSMFPNCQKPQDSVNISEGSFGVLNHNKEDSVNIPECSFGTVNTNKDDAGSMSECSFEILNANKEDSGSISECSFGTLNHNKEDSSFTEVIPKQSHCKFNSLSTSSPHVNKTSKNSDDLYQMSSVTKEVTAVPEKEKEEEDLLTSTRTHFRPIRQENPETHNNNTACYADGTTFVIPNSWESVPFKRSESGALYLETDLGIETPKKYMEYKEKELHSARYTIAKSLDYSASLGRDFIPKFRVHQIEKCCQTEESEECVISDEEIYSKRSRQDVKSLDSEFYFPGDEHFAAKVVNCSESEDEHVEETAMESEPFSFLPANNNACDIKEQITNGSKLQNLPAISHTQVSPKQKEKIYFEWKAAVNNRCKCCLTNNNVCEIKGEKLTNVAELQNLRTVSRVLAFPEKQEKMYFEWKAAVNNHCKCNHNFSEWESDWHKASNGLNTSKDGIWGPSAATVQSHAWNDIWKSTYDSDVGICRNCAEASKKSPLNMSPQRLRLREELSQDGEQLLSDLSYMQHLYQGSDSNDSEAGCVEEMQCLSPPTETSNDVQLYDDSEFDNSQENFHNSPVYDLHGKENESFGDFVAPCTPKVLPVKVLLSMEVGTAKKMNERPFSLKMSAKDRKRRHSGCLRQINNNQCPENYNNGVQAGYESSAAVGYHISTTKDSVRWKGSCSSRSLRPVTL